MSEDNKKYGILSPEKNTFNNFVAPTFPPIANFWRRIFAFLLDYLIIGVAGLIITLPFSYLLFKIGPYGHFVGLLITLPYFGIMNSRLCNGQTLGKRMLKIAVRNGSNRSISLQLSFLRTAILLIPTIFSISLGIKFIDGFFSILSSGVSLALPLIYIFNKTARQSLHDMVVGTYVVHLVDKRIYAYPKTENKFWILSAASLVLAALLIFGAKTITASIFPQMKTAQSSYENKSLSSEEFFSVEFSELTMYHGDGVQTKTLVIDCWYKGKVTNDIANRLSTAIAYAIIHDNQIDLEQYDYLKINIYSKYDIGISNAHFNVSKSMTVDEWKNIVLNNK
jgi:uncharacterized RDD family membrane protein YckC